MLRFCQWMSIWWNNLFPEASLYIYNKKQMYYQHQQHEHNHPPLLRNLKRFPPIFNFLPLPTPRGSSKSQLLLLVLLECPSQSHPSPSLRRVASTKRTGPHLSNLSLNMRGRESVLLLCDNDVFIGWALYIWRRCWCDDEDYDYITMMTILLNNNDDAGWARSTDQYNNNNHSPQSRGQSPSGEKQTLISFFIATHSIGRSLSIKS